MANTTLKLLTLAAAGMITFFASTAQAATLSCEGFNKQGKSGTTYTLGHALMVECVDGENDANYVTPTTSILGMTGWTLEEKLDATGSGNNFDFGNDTAASNAAKSGKISADLSAFEHAFIVLKAGNAFGAFKVLTTDTMWDWETSKGISHVSVWTKGSVSPVPLPAGGVLLIAALSALGLRRIRF